MVWIVEFESMEFTELEQVAAAISLLFYYRTDLHEDLLSFGKANKAPVLVPAGVAQPYSDCTTLL